MKKLLLLTTMIVLLSSTAWSSGCYGHKPYKPTSYCPNGWALICLEDGAYGNWQWICTR